MSRSGSFISSALETFFATLLMSAILLKQIRLEKYIMEYRHHWVTGDIAHLPVGKVVCVGRNYAAHAKELNNPIPTEPLLFMKPATSLCRLQAPLQLPDNKGAVHFETELAILIGETLNNCDAITASQSIAGIGLALDLTLRDIQAELKEKGLPWEKAKAFDNSCPITGFVPYKSSQALQTIRFTLHLNGVLRQEGFTGDMIMPVAELISRISEYFTLLPGDIVLTGTPAGVGPLSRGDVLDFVLEESALEISTFVK